MSRYLTIDLKELTPYVPGEQPVDKKYIKLNTNESPFPPSPEVLKAINDGEKGKLNLYPDPEALSLRKALAESFGVSAENVIVTNGSDETLSFAFRAFCGSDKGAAFADITYGFYPVYCKYYGIKCKVLPLNGDFTINTEDYISTPETVFIANPNAQTGIFLPVEEIEKIASSDINRVVVVDEAYVDFGSQSCIGLTKKYPNLLVVGTFSKSRSLAGGRLGYAVGDRELIGDLNTVRYSFHPYSVNRLTMVAGIAAIKDKEYFEKCTKEIIKTREYTSCALKNLGFYVTPSAGNFILARHDKMSGKALYSRLKGTGILVRIFPDERIRDFIRITIGTKTDMETFVLQVGKILQEVDNEGI
jgi:histidinol-phosphate aminotransferase